MQILSGSYTTAIMIMAVSFVMLLVGIVVTYFWIIKRYFSDLGKIKKFDDQIAENANNILRQARAEAEEMRQNANTEAERIMASATNFQTQRDQFITSELVQLEQNYKKEFEKTIVSVQNNIEGSISGLPEELKQSLKSELDVYRDNFREELTHALQSSKSLIEEAYSNLQKDLEDYKKQRYQQIDERIIDIVKITAREVLGKQLTIDEHEKLVLKTLEQAKKQEVI